MREPTPSSTGSGTTADITIDADTTTEKSTYLDAAAPKVSFGLLLALRDSRLLNGLPKTYRLLIDNLILRSKFTDDVHTRAYCYPRYSTLAKDTDTCEKTLKLAAAALEDLDLVTRTYRGFGTNIFVINVEKIWAAAQDAHKKEAEEAKAKEAEAIQNAVTKKTGIKEAAAKRAATMKTSEQNTTVTPVAVPAPAPAPQPPKGRWVGSDEDVVTTASSADDDDLSLPDPDADDAEDGDAYPNGGAGDLDGGAR